MDAIELSWTPASYDWAMGGKKVKGTKSENGNQLTNDDGDCSSGVCTGGTLMVRVYQYNIQCTN